jgi:hypothetical protein
MRFSKRKGLLRMTKMARGRLGVRGWIGVIVSVVLVVIELAFLIPAYLVVAYAIIVMKEEDRRFRQVCQEVIIPSYFSGYVRDVYFFYAHYDHSGRSIYHVSLDIDLRDRSEHLAEKDRYVTFHLDLDCDKGMPLLAFLDRGDSIVKYPNGLKVRVIKKNGWSKVFILPFMECYYLRDEEEYYLRDEEE